MGSEALNDFRSVGAEAAPVLGASSLFCASRPETQTSPLIFAPANGRLCPAGFVRRKRLDVLTLRKSEEASVDGLFGCGATMGVPLLLGCLPRAYIDSNRARGEIDASMFDGRSPVMGPPNPRVAAGLGVIPRFDLQRPSARREVLFRFENVYRP